MKPIEIILVADAQGASVIRAANLNVTLDFKNAAVQVTGQQIFTLSNGSEHESNLPLTAIRLNELNEMLPGMADGDQKQKLEAKKAVWEKFMKEMEKPLQLAVKAIYELDNPVIS